MTEKKTTKKQDKPKEAEEVKFKGKYIQAIGRRKTSVARIRLYKNGQGTIAINGLSLNKYFSADKVVTVTQPLKIVSHLRDVDLSIITKGGGKSGQADAIRHGLVRALISLDEKLRDTFKAKGWLTRDRRKKERKKPGLKKARKAPQWSKR